MKNEYKINGDIVTIYLAKKDGTYAETIIEHRDLERANEYRGSWYLSRNYVRGNIRKPDGSKTTLTLHRWLVGEDGFVVDHINHDTLDNRKSNLRNLLPSENSLNRSGPQANGNGTLGVTFSQKYNRWYARFSIKGIRHFVGSYLSKEEATRALQDERNKHINFSDRAVKGGVKINK